MHIQRLISLLFLVLMGCSAEHTPQRQRPLGGGGKDRDPLRDPTACYAGRPPHSPQCYKIVAFDKLGDQAEKYNYPDPYNDSSFPDGFDRQQYVPPVFFLNLENISVADFLSQNFQIREMIPSDKDRGTFGFYSTQVMKMIQELRFDLNRPMKIHSGYRSPAHNGGLPGAAKWSRHTYGDAIDFTSDGYTLEQLAERCLQHGADFYQLYATHIHCDWRNEPMADSFFSPAAPRPAENKTTLRKKVNAAVSELVEVRVNETIGSSLIEFRIDAPQEDLGELQIQWRIVTADKKIVESRMPHLQLERIPGLYQVAATVGGSLQIHRHIKIK